MDVTLPDLVGFANYNGIEVCCVGEDGDSWVALGHHDPKDALEAFNRYAQHVIGLVDVTDGLTPPEQYLPPQPLWAVLREHCEEYDDPDHEPDCYQCQNIQEAGWWLDWSVTKDVDHAFPIMVLNF